MIWNYVYNTHCQNSEKVCHDNKFLYKLISGMHMSVSSHLSYFYKDSPTDITKPNLEAYKQRLDGKKERLGNLLFVNRLMTLAFNQYYPTMEKLPVDSGDFFDD